MKKKYYWKAVKVESPGLFKSCYINDGRYSLKYRIGISTQSAMIENGIFVFDTRKNARKFISQLFDRKNKRIFKCKVEGEEIKNPVLYDTLDLMNNKKSYQYGRFPDGTRSFPSVTLIK